MKRLSFPYHATPKADPLLEKGYDAGIPEYAWETHFELLFNHLPKDAQERIRKIAEEADPTIGTWEPSYWANIPQAMEALIHEYETIYPGAQLIWSKDFPDKHQLEDYGPEMVHFDEDFGMIPLGETFDGLAHIYHPRPGEPHRIPPDLFRKVNPQRLIERGWEYDDDEDEDEEITASVDSLMNRLASLADAAGHHRFADALERRMRLAQHEDRIPAFRGVGPRGLKEPRLSPGGVYGPGYYLYQHPLDAREYASPGGGIIVGTVPGDTQVHEDGVIVLDDLGKLHIVGHVPTENTLDADEIMRLIREMGVDPGERWRRVQP